MKTLKPINDNIILKGTTKKSSIITPEAKELSYKLEKLEVFLIGDEVKKVKVGQEVKISPNILREIHRSINPFQKELKGDQEFYISVTENEIIGYFN